MALGALLSSRRIWLLISLVNNLALLLFFKYARFVIENLNAVLCLQPAPSFKLPDPSTLMPFGFDYLLPVGISFFTFQSMSYTIDFYFGNVHRERNFLRFATFVCFFPQLMAGPIERARHLLPQFHEFPAVRLQNFTDGAFALPGGACSRSWRWPIISRSMSNGSTTIPGALRRPALILATFAFAWQIFFDFSGYTDMARGVAKLMGFNLILNFNNPYLATGLGDFWSRWHISLSTWFRDYVYIPLGGNRHGKFSTYRNLFLTFFISGIWHGAAWTFAIWGALHAMGVMITRELERSEFYRERVPKLAKQLAVFAFVCFAWIFFRAESLERRAADHWPHFHALPGMIRRSPLLMLALVLTVWLYQFPYESRFRPCPARRVCPRWAGGLMVLYLCPVLVRRRRVHLLPVLTWQPHRHAASRQHSATEISRQPRSLRGQRDPAECGAMDRHVGLLALIMFLTPHVWKHVERFQTGPDYRIPYELSKDYWLYQWRLEQVTDPKRVFVVGDSVVWGEYVLPDGTLSHFLSEETGQAGEFVNAGVNGLFPLALEGLVRYYGHPLHNRKVVLHCNVLWMSSPKADLQITKEERFNHSRLVPQFRPRIPCYKADANERLGAIIERHVGFISWVTHLQDCYFAQKNILSWTLEEGDGDPPTHPNVYKNPLAQISLKVPSAPANDPQRGPRSARHRPWSQNGGRGVHFDWVTLDSSLQWGAFQRLVKLLRDRGNDLVVVLGPFNEHMIADESKPGFLKIRDGIAAWLEQNHVPHVVPEVLPSELYADASHPLTDGYALLAKRLWTNETFRAWATAK